MKRLVVSSLTSAVVILFMAALVRLGVNSLFSSSALSAVIGTPRCGYGQALWIEVLMVLARDSVKLKERDVKGE